MLRRTYRNANGKNFMVEYTFQPKKTMGDLPPEVMLIIFEHLTLNQSRNSLLSYRRVSSQWKQNLDSIIEKKIVSRVSTKLEPFPEMLTKVTGQHDLLTVYQSPATLRNDGDVFPFNSATLAKKIDNDNLTDYLHIGLTMGSYGASLTSFGLQDQAVDLTFMVSILGTMPNLKLLRLSGVSLTNDLRNLRNAALPSPPPMPCLTSLCFGGSTVDKDLIVYLWLLCFYADQLVSLKLDTNLEFPALEQKQVYSETHNGHIIRFGTTSESAFGKLKKLEIKLPTVEFLDSSELPVLKSLSVTGLREHVDMQDIFVLIDKCSQTLENLCLVVREDSEERMFLNQQFMVSGTLSPLTEVLFPKLKTFTIPYPKSECEEMIIGSKFLILFPALEELQFLECSSQYPIKDTEERKRMNGGKRRRGPRTMKEIGDLKNRLVSINEWLVERRRKLFGKQNALRRGLLNLHGRQREKVQLKLETELNYDGKYEKTPIFHRLAGLGENVQKILVEQYLERQGIWKTCPKLNVVYVSSKEKPSGDICVIPRIDSVMTQH